MLFYRSLDNLGRQCFGFTVISDNRFRIQNLRLKDRFPMRQFWNSACRAHVYQFFGLSGNTKVNDILCTGNIHVIHFETWQRGHRDDACTMNDHQTSAFRYRKKTLQRRHIRHITDNNFSSGWYMFGCRISLQNKRPDLLTLGNQRGGNIVSQQSGCSGQ
ncbi:hypothetical protein D3C85_1327860 [compost metagenome]